jgi:hypothetical protein
MSDGHRGGFNSPIKVARGPITFIFGYLVEGQECSFWLHVRAPRAQSEGGFGVADALKMLGFAHFDNCSLVDGDCYYMNLRGREPLRPLAGEALEPRFDELVKELPGIIQSLISVAQAAESLGLKLRPTQE